MVEINHSPSSTTSANQMATEVLNAEAHGEGPVSPFRNAAERSPSVTSLWEPPISPPPITRQRVILDKGQEGNTLFNEGWPAQNLAFLIHAFNESLMSA